MKKLIHTLILAVAGINFSNAQVNYIDSYINNSVTFTTIATSSNQLNQPRDLDFKPNTNELWVCNYGNSSGGTMDIFFNAGLPNQTNQLRQDDHSDHFFYYPSAIAFSNNGQFGAVSEIQNTSSSSPTFMGPSLWLSDTSIFARVWQNNWTSGYPLGSHIDMLHQSPFSMGIAFEAGEAYWVMDGYNGNICKYDFVMDHGPGYDNHSAGKIWRYSDVTFTRVPQVPSHMVLDKTNNWLYFIDGGLKEIKRMNILSGTFSGNLTVPSTANEPLAGYYNYLGATVETLDSLTTQPCGMDYYNGRLIVSDYTTGDIYIYNTNGTVSLLDTIVTGHPGMMGVKIGPDGHIWCVNKTENKVYRLDAVPPTADAAIVNITSPIVTDYQSNYYATAFNVCNGNITPAVSIKNMGITTITSMQIDYSLDGGAHTVYNWTGSLGVGNSIPVTLPTASVNYGSHQLSAFIILVNGIADDIEMNNTYDGSFRVFSPSQGLPFTEDFAGSNFPPTNWSYVHFNTNNFMKRANASGYGSGSGSMKMDNFSGSMNITGQKDYLLSPIIDFTSAAANTYLTFDVAYAQYANGDNDELKIVVSTDCGNNWTQIYDKAGDQLFTAPVTTSSFTPSASQWRTDTVSLSAYVGQSDVIFMFTAISNFGNNLYVDNIYAGTVNVGIDETTASSLFNIFPNPVTDILNIEFTAATIGTITVSDVLGKQVFSKQIFNTQNNFQLSTVDWNSGIYFITLQSDKTISTQKFIKQ